MGESPQKWRLFCFSKKDDTISDMSKDKLKNIIRFVPMLLVMAVIFFFSSMEGDDSSQTSGIFLKALVKFASEVSHKGFSAEAMANLHLIIRKCAHFTEYAALGGTTVYAFKNLPASRKLLTALSEGICFVYAASDEIHQYFVPGRYGTFGDVVIDSCGAIVGIVLMVVVFRKKHDSAKSRTKILQNHENMRS